MPWSKGAVVIKKYGDEEWSDAIEKTINIKKASDKEKEELERENTFMKRHVKESLEQKIANAERDYGYNWIPPKWMKPIMDILALIAYGVALFFDKFLTLR